MNVYLSERWDILSNKLDAIEQECDSDDLEYIGMMQIVLHAHLAGYIYRLENGEKISRDQLKRSYKTFLSSLGLNSEKYKMRNEYIRYLVSEIEEIFAELLKYCL